MNIRQQTPRRFEFAFDERFVEDELGAVVCDLRLPPAFNLTLERLKITLNPVHSYCKRVDQVEARAVLRQHRSKHA